MTKESSEAGLAERLKSLPELAPPEGAWPRIREAAESARRRRAKQRLGLGLAAGFAVAAFALGVSLRVPDSEPSVASTRGDDFSGIRLPVAYDALLAESARLDHLLHALPRRGHVMSAETAGTIVGLEDRIALIDERLTLATAGGARPEYRQALWQERVDVMNALVRVRYAQAQDLGF